MAFTSVFDHVVDNAPNRLIKTAIWFVAEALRGQFTTGHKILGDLERAYRLFDQVHLDLATACLADPDVIDPSRIPDSRAYYVPAIEIARAIVEGRPLDLEHQGDGLVLPSLLIDLQSAFEDYLRQVLRAAFRSRPAGLAVLDGNYRETDGGGGKDLFDSGSTMAAAPDIVVKRHDGRPPYALIGEVKYIDRDFDRDHVDQALAYGTSYRAPVVLVRPALRGEHAGLTEVGRIDSDVLYRYCFDLRGDLVDQELRFVTSLRTLAMANVPVPTARH
jgi:5-methylcytosine-specific restriction enzyme subunit McrC